MSAEREYVYVVLSEAGRTIAAYTDSSTAEEHADIKNAYVDRVLLTRGDSQ